MKNILIVIPNLNSSGGTERAATNLANMLLSDYRVTILSLTRQLDKSLYYINPQVRVIYQDISSKSDNVLKKFEWSYRCYKTVSKIIKNYDINIVIGLTHNINTIISMLNRSNIKTIGCEHIDYNSIPKNSRLIIKKTYPKLNALIVLSEHASKAVEYLNDNIIIIPNSLPFESNTVSKLSNSKILMVGRLSKEKGYERVIPLSKYLLKKYPTWSIYIFGDGEIRDELKKIIIKDKLHNIKLNNPVENIKAEYLNASIFLSTSYNEALPMVFLEAMSCGLPIISYKNQGTDALIDNNIDGIVVESNNELIVNMDELINNIELRASLGANGKIKSLEFTTHKIKKKWLNLLSQL